MMNFPPLRAAVLTALVDIKANLAALDREDCPYDNETKGLLKDLLTVKVVEKIVEKERPEGAQARGRPSKDIRLDEEDQKKVLDEIKTQIDALNSLDSDGLQTNERIQIAKTKASLLDQLLKMMERHTTVQKVESFKEVVIGILNDYVDESGRDMFLKRLEQFR